MLLYQALQYDFQRWTAQTTSDHHPSYISYWIMEMHLAPVTMIELYGNSLIGRWFHRRVPTRTCIINSYRQLRFRNEIETEQTSS